MEKRPVGFAVACPYSLMLNSTLQRQREDCSGRSSAFDIGPGSAFHSEDVAHDDNEDE